ncbi:MAG: threonine/serine dehydratase [Trueperaceae bacterium]
MSDASTASPHDLPLPTVHDLRRAADRIAPYVRRTPLLPLPADGPGALGPDLWLKPEQLQRTGSFKLRGATNVLATIDPSVRERGVVTHSSGNHGQAVACAAAAFGVPATVAIPEGAPRVKLERTRAWGATVIRCANTAESRAEAARTAAEATGATIVPPYDHPGIVSGQGTVGLEIVADLPDVANVLVPVGGGGLASGVAVALAELAPRARLIAVEPREAGDVHDSLAHGERRTWPAERTTSTVADGVRTQTVGALPWRILRERLHAVVLVDDEELLDAASWFPHFGRTVVEPTGALALAAWRRIRRGDADGVTLANGPTVLIATGGNVDVEALTAFLTRPDPDRP